MDIGKVAQNEAREEEAVVVPIFQKDGEPYLGPDKEQATISVLGSDSKAVRKQQDKNTRKIFAASARGGRKRLSPEAHLENRVSVCVAAVTGWSGWTVGSKPAAFNEDNLRALLVVPHVLRQVEAGISGHSDFFTSASES